MRVHGVPLEGFSAGRPAEWIETVWGAPGVGKTSTVSPLEDQRSGLKHGRVGRRARRGRSFSAGRPAEWIETSYARASRRARIVSPLEDQRSGLKRESKQCSTIRFVSPLEDQRSGLKQQSADLRGVVSGVSPLEDQRSGLKHGVPYSLKIPDTVSPLEDQRSGLKPIRRTHERRK